MSAHASRREAVERSPRRRSHRRPSRVSRRVDRRLVDAATVGARRAASGRRTAPRRAAGAERCRWPALTFAVKDNIDVAGLPTTAACPAFAYVPPRRRAGGRAPRGAGRGRRRQDQPRPVRHRPGRHPLAVRRCPNAHWPGWSPAARAPARRSPSARGLVDFALGTDTAGSGRVPAACNGIVGLKPTRGRISTAGVVPACRSLDCVSVFARDVDRRPSPRPSRLARRRTRNDPWSREAPHADVPRVRRIGVPLSHQLDFDGEPAARTCFASAVDDPH